MPLLMGLGRLYKPLSLPEGILEVNHRLAQHRLAEFNRPRV
jgi:hypothetical protein